MPLPDSYLDPAPAFSRLLYLCACDCLHWPPLWLCCDTKRGGTFLKYTLPFGGVYKLSGTGGVPFVCSQPRGECV